MPKSSFDPELLQFCEPQQRTVLEAMLREGSSTKAAAVLGRTPNSVKKIYERVKTKAAKRGWSPAHGMTKVVPPTHFVKGTSTLYDGDGKIALQWVKSEADRETMRKAMQVFADELASQVKGKFKKGPKAPKHCNADIATHYKVGDQHLGLYAWGEETGDEDYDLERSTADIRGGLRYLIEASEPTAVGCLVNVGDFLHANDRKSQTPGSGNLLDTDTRHGKVARRAAHIMRDAIRCMLAKHQEVHVFNARGNHDPDSAVWLQIVLEAYFENEPRVKIARNDRKMLVWQFGDVVSFIYHGEKNRTHQLEYITDKFREEIGNAKFCYVDNGHVHHKDAKELGPLKFEVWNPLCATDIYHADSLYGASRSMTSVTYHKRFGEVGRNTCDIRMIRDREAT